MVLSNQRLLFADHSTYIYVQLMHTRKSGMWQLAFGSLNIPVFKNSQNSPHDYPDFS
jgi:hypothetical protein